jgi:methyl-accepting chemotaxis protein
MKINEPVTEREVPFPEGAILVSKTDRKGVITYANPAFVAISGYAEQELLGRSHNIVRHPDMPPEAFRDLWDTVAAGRTWTGIVKNRAKNGDYYWVRANVTPIPLPNGEVEYMSVRTPPTAQERQSAERLYAELRAGRAGMRSSLAIGSRWSVQAILGLSVLVTGLALGALAAGATAAPDGLLYALLAGIAVSGLGIAALLSTHVIRPLRSAAQRLHEFVAGDYFNWAEVSETGVVGDIQQAIRSTQIKLGFEVTDAQRRADETTRVQTALDCATTNVMVADAEFNICYLNNAVQRMLAEAETDLREKLPGFSSSTVLGSRIDLFHSNPAHQRKLLAGLHGTFSSELQVGSRTFRIIANPVVNPAGQRLGTVVEWADLTEQRALEREREAVQEDERRRAAENLRIRTALDSVSSCVMMTDPDGRALYLNTAAEQLFRRGAVEIAAAVPGFNAQGLLGSDANALLPLRKLVGPDRTAGAAGARGEVALGGLTLGYTANPVVDGAGEVTGAVVELVDRTAELAMEDELEEIVAAARAGELGRRVSIEGKSGFFRHLAVGINALLDDLASVFADLSDSLAAMSDGDLTKPVLHDYKGEFGHLKDSLNSTLVHVSKTVVQLSEAAQSINAAANEISSGNTNLSARTEQQASNLQETAASMEQLTSTVRNNADNAQQANQVAANARQLAHKGGDVVNRAVTAMDQINTASNRIAEIIGVIDEIAFQTNLLALNASVEAARAGEQGRGFAVVATEVRNLASRSAEAAKQIKELIADSMHKVRTGAELVHESGETLTEIVDGVKKVGDIVAEIAAASGEQAAGIDQVSQTIVALDEMTQQNAALAEQTSAASMSLYDKARDMDRLVRFFTTSTELEQLIGGPPVHQHAHHAGNDHADAEFDFFAARTAHLAWRQRIRDFLDGAASLSHEEAVSHRDCSLGKWLYGHGLERYGHVEEMGVLESEHERLHAVIREIVDLKHGAEQAAAEKRFEEIDRLSARIVSLLKSVERRVAH